MKRPQAAVALERLRQIERWGHQEHQIFKWLAILTEEVGEAAQEALDGAPALDKLRAEVVQVAAVAHAILEDIERRGTDVF